LAYGKRSSAFGLVVGILGLIYGTTRLTQSGLYAMTQVWNIPNATRPNFVARLGRSITFLLLLALSLALTTVLTALGGFGGQKWYVGVVSGLAAAVINVLLYCSAFRVLTPKQVEWRALLPGAISGGIAWTILQTLGTYVIGHDLKGSSALYGTFGLVLGLMAWIFLGAQITVYAAVINPGLTFRLWPRAIVQPPLLWQASAQWHYWRRRTRCAPGKKYRVASTRVRWTKASSESADTAVTTLGGWR
jgi:uncharacterized BrkB/YihY/UPF0761 family membrane protein